MLFTRARLNPWKALAWASSPCRLMSTLPLSTFRLVRRGNSQLSRPLGPSTETCCPLTSTLTFAGMVIGCLPMRDICFLDQEVRSKQTCSPDVTKQLAADVLFARLRIGH